MPRLVFDTCCGCMTLKTGCLIIGYVQLVYQIIGILAISIGFAVGSAGYSFVEDAGSHIPEPYKIQEESVILSIIHLFMIILGILLFFIIVALAFTITFLVGVHQDKRGHILAYFIYAVIFLVIVLILFLVGIGNGAKAAFYIIMNLIYIMLNIYFLLVVRSHYVKLGDSPAVYSGV